METLCMLFCMCFGMTLGVISYRWGVKDSKRESKNLSGEAPIIKAPFSLKKKKEPHELTRMKQILANVEAYDGTGDNQEEVGK
jgi:hypothetical protein